MNCVQDCDLTVGEPEGVFLDLYAVLRAERGPKVESDALEILETWQRTERLCENILKLCDLKLITGACTGLSVAWERKQRHEKKHTLSASWKETKLRMIALIIHNLADVGGKGWRSKDASAVLCAVYAIADVYLTECMRGGEVVAGRVDGSECEEVRGGGDVLGHDADEFNGEALHDRSETERMAVGEDMGGCPIYKMGETDVLPRPMSVLYGYGASYGLGEIPKWARARLDGVLARYQMGPPIWSSRKVQPRFLTRMHRLK